MMPVTSALAEVSPPVVTRQDTGIDLLPTGASLKPPSLVCDKCGIVQSSGERSCCSPGGSWHKQCGDAGDINFEHSWLEGIEACFRK